MILRTDGLNDEPNVIKWPYGLNQYHVLLNLDQGKSMKMISKWGYIQEVQAVHTYKQKLLDYKVFIASNSNLISSNIKYCK